MNTTPENDLKLLHFLKPWTKGVLVEDTFSPNLLPSIYLIPLYAFRVKENGCGLFSGLDKTIVIIGVSSASNILGIAEGSIAQCDKILAT